MGYVIKRWGAVVGGPYPFRDEALAQAFEKGAMPPNGAYRFPPFTETGPQEPLYQESHMFAGWEISEVSGGGENSD